MQTITPAARDQVVRSLVPYFLVQAQGDQHAAWHEVRETLDSYGATTDHQMRLAALFIAFSLQALDSLARAAEPGLDVKTALRLKGNANALNRAAMQAQRSLCRAQAGEAGRLAEPEAPAIGVAATVQPTPQPSVQPPPHSAEPSMSAPPIPAALSTSPPQATKAAATETLSRQQRRALERLARKSRPQRQSLHGPANGGTHSRSEPMGVAA